MENRRFVEFLIFPLGIFLIFPLFSFAYNDKTTHPALTGEIVNLFNYYYPDFKISDADKEAIKKGSTDEDIAPRWMQHFYDPVYNRGLIFGAEWERSKDWAQDTLAQAEYDPVFVASLGTVTRKLFSSGTDYSWDRAVYEYAWGDKEKALESLGHDLHLLEDATVPEHTRNDVHLPFFDWGSPYEDWTSQFNDKNFFLADKLIQENKRPIIFSDLSQYFNNNAIYSNNNFFSKDTVLKDYENPKINFEKSEILSDKKIHIFGYNDKNVKLIELRKQRDLETGLIKNTYIIDDDDHLILTDYWNFLSRQAILSGTGVVKLFFDEVAKEKKSKILLSKNTSLLAQFTNKLAAIINSVQTAAIGAWNELTGNGQSSIIVQSLPLAETVSSSGSTPSPSTTLALSSNPSAQENDSSQIVAEAQFPEYSPFPSVPSNPNPNPSPNNFSPSLPSPGFGGGSAPASPQSQTPSSASSDMATTTASTGSPRMPHNRFMVLIRPKPFGKEKIDCGLN